MTHLLNEYMCVHLEKYACIYRYPIPHMVLCQMLWERAKCKKNATFFTMKENFKNYTVKVRTIFKW